MRLISSDADLLTRSQLHLLTLAEIADQASATPWWQFRRRARIHRQALEEASSIRQIIQEANDKIAPAPAKRTRYGHAR